MKRILDTAPGLAFFCAAALAALALLAAVHSNFSAAVLALVLSLMVLALFGKRAETLRPGARVLLRWFPLFFVPSCVRIIDYTGVLQAQWPGVSVALIASTLIGLAAGIAAGAALKRLGAA